MVDATWTGYGAVTWTISNPTVTKSSGSSWGANTIYATSIPTNPDNVLIKWVSGNSTITAGLSTLSYISANNDQLGLQYGFSIKPYDDSNYATWHKGSVLTQSSYGITIDEDTEFKITTTGSKIKWFVDDVEIDSVDESLDADTYFWTNNNRQATASINGYLNVVTSSGSRLPPPPITVRF